MVRRTLLGTKTSRGRDGASPRFAVLSFTPPTTPGLRHIEIYRRPGTPPQDVLADRQRVVDRISGVYPYYHILIHSTAGATYVVDYLDSNLVSALGAANRIATEVYAPPTPAAQEVNVNGAQYARELVRRDQIVLETMGEQAILLRKKRSGLICACRQDESRNPNICPTCYRTGFEGGFDVFSPFLFNFQLAGEQIQLTETALVMNQNPRAWTAIAPEIRDGDFVVRLHGQLMDRFQITNPTRSVRDGVSAVPTIQEFQVKVHQQGHPVYDFPVERFVPSYVKPATHAGLTEKGV